MSIADAVSGAVAALRRRPSDLLPWYLLGAAIPAIVRLVPFLAVAVGYVYLERTGRLATAQEAWAEVDTDPPDPEANPDAFDEWVSGLEPVIEPLLTRPMGILVAVTVLLSLLLVVTLYPYVVAGQLTACSARLRGNRGLVAGFAGAQRYWLRFLGLYVLEIVAWIAVFLTIGMGIAVAAAIAMAATGMGAVAILIGLVALFVLFAALAAVRAVFAFAPVAIVVDDTTTFGSLSNTLGFVRAQPLQAGFYYAISLGTLIAVSTVSGLLVLVDVVVFPSLVTMLLVFPFLDLVKTALYNDYRGRLTPPASPDRSLRAQLLAGTKRGWAEMTTFVRATLPTHAAVVVLAFASFWVGWELAAPLADAPAFESSISARLEGHVPPAAALEFFGNNWMVALTTAFSGVALVLPAIASLVFNGLMMGVYGRTEVEPTELLAFVIPHGIFEIPAIFIATVVGVWLGRAGWRTYRGPATRGDLADALERAFWVLVGVGVLLAVAGIIEGFVSPYYFRLFL